MARPDLASANSARGPLCANAESVFYNPPGGTVTAGVWAAVPSECGPYNGTAPAGTATDAMVAQTKAFDSTVTSTTGDFWTAAVGLQQTFSPVTINPGRTAEVNATFTPTGGPGTVVLGTLYVDDVTDAVPPYASLSGSELAAIPYRYTIRRPRHHGPHHR